MYTDPMLPQNQDLMNTTPGAPEAAFVGETLNIDPFDHTSTPPVTQAPVENIVFQDPIATPIEPVAVAPEVITGETLNIDPFETPLQTPPAPAPQPAIPEPAPMQTQVPAPEPIPTQQTPTPSLSPNIPPMPATTQAPNPVVEENDDDISLSFLDETLETPLEPISQTTPQASNVSAQPEPEAESDPVSYKSLDRTGILDQTIARMTERKEEVNEIKTGKENEVSNLESQIADLKEQVSNLK